MQRVKPTETIAGVFMARMKQAIARELNVVDLLGTTEILHAARETDLALELYKTWIQYNTDHPLCYAVNFNHGVMLSDAGRTADARDALREAIRLNPAFLPPYVNLGTVLERLGDLPQAVTQWLSVVNTLPTITPENLGYKLTALKQIGRTLEAAQQEQQAEEVLRQGLELHPRQRDVAQHWIALRQVQCKWPVLQPPGAVTTAGLLGAMSPLSVAAYVDDPMFQLAAAHNYYVEEVADFTTPFTVGRFPRPDAAAAPRRLRVGYVSSDLRSHAVGFLTAEIFELHDRAAVEVFVYYSGPDMNDATQQRIRRTVDHWLDITARTDKQAASEIVGDGIDILVDLNGYTRDARTKLFALRPAPVIVNWLGYPGTAGSPHHDYIIADSHIIPPELERYFSEQVLRLPCYQPTDRQRVVAGACGPRGEAGLPEDGVVFCCFNGLQKLTQPVFRRWMAILAGVPGSVLWLLTPGDATLARLRQEAAALGVDPLRLVCADKRANPEHLARYRLADLFLDTTPYGAHTTTSDALWMGVPVLTVSGSSFASRVCASLVIAAGLPELVCDDFDTYQNRAIELGRDPAALRALRARVTENRATSTLFDTPLLVRSLERLYAGMWEAFQSGTVPEPDLTNLPVYHAVGCAAPQDIPPAADQAAYRQRYRSLLATRDGVSRLPPDRRFWDAATA